MSRNNNVRGPSSALTEFLRECGITPTTIANRVRQAPPQPPPVAGPSNTSENVADGGGALHGVGEPEAGYSSDKLDDSEAEQPTPKKRKLGKKALEKLKAKEKSKKKKGDEYQDDDDDEYTALSKSAFTGGPKSPMKPPVGSFDNCANCAQQFTVTRYTVAANPPPGFLCHDCAKASGADPFKKAAPPRRRKNPEDKRKIINFDDKELPSLATMCINVISQHIEDVEALGDIGAVNMDEISRVLAKNRSLTPENATLLYDVNNTELTLYDATKLTPPAFCTLASLNPGLESLRLDYCGRIDDTSLTHWSGHLASLHRVQLLGPFLIRVDAWRAFFESHPQLTGFLITQSPRFDLSCMDSLAASCLALTELRLSQIGKMTDEFLPHIASFAHLTSLDLSEPSASLSTEAVVALLGAVGANLTHLNLSGNTLLSDAMLIEGIQRHARALESLVLDDLPDITNAGVAELFSALSMNPPLHRISFRRNHSLADNALAAALAHSSRALTELNINSWKDLQEDALKAIGDNAHLLKKLDLGWCRQVDDYIIKSILDSCVNITDISVYGCNKLTGSCPRKRGVKIRGIETHAI